MRKQSVFRLSYTFITLCLLTACVNNVDLSNVSKDILLDQSMDFPLGESSITVKNLVEKIVDEDLISQQGEEIYFTNNDSSEFSFRSIDINKNSKAIKLNRNFPVGVFPPQTSIPPIEIDDTTDLGLNTDMNSERIDSVRLESLHLDVNLNLQDLQFPRTTMQVILTFPRESIHTSDGTPIVIKINPSEGDVTSATFTLNDVVLNTSKGAKGIPFHLRIEARTGSNQVITSQNSKISMSLMFNNMNWKVVYGYFKPSLKAFNKLQIPLDMMNSLPDAVMKFANPKASIKIGSNIGTYINFHVNYVKAFAKNNDASAVYASFNGNQYIDYNVSKPAFVGAWAEKTFVMDKDNGAVDRLFDNDVRPDVLEYMFSSQLDTISIKQNPQLPNFILPDSKIKAQINTTIPLHLKAGSIFEVTDTISDIGESFSKLDIATLILNITNGFPAQVSFSFAFLDKNGKKIVSTLNNKVYPIIKSPSVNADGIVNSANLSPQLITVDLTKEDLSTIKDAKDMEYSIKFEGGDNNSKALHFQNSNSFKVKLSVKAKANTVENF